MRALDALKFYKAQCGYGPKAKYPADDQTALVDLLSDLHHLDSQRMTIDLDLALAQSYDHFTVESLGEQ